MTDRTLHPFTAPAGQPLDVQVILAAFDPGQPLPLSVDQAVRAAVRSWVHSDGQLPLQRLLGLMPTPRRQRLAVRDHYLRQAAALIPEPSPWHRALQLQLAVDTFNASRWPCWRGMRQAPSHATPTEALLFAAASMSDEPLPSSPATLLDITRQIGQTAE